MRPAHERRLYIVTMSLIGWAHTCSPYFLVIIHQTQARDDIDGLMQERRNSIANALGHVFLAPSNPYKECHLSPPLFVISFNAMQSIWQCLEFFCFFYKCYHWSMYWVYSITLYCTATYREYHIATVKIRDTQPLPPLPILILIIEVKLTLSSHSTLVPRYVTHIVLL